VYPTALEPATQRLHDPANASLQTLLSFNTMESGGAGPSSSTGERAPGDETDDDADLEPAFLDDEADEVAFDLDEEAGPDTAPPECLLMVYQCTCTHSPHAPPWSDTAS